MTGTTAAPWSWVYHTGTDPMDGPDLSKDVADQLTDTASGRLGRAWPCLSTGRPPHLDGRIIHETNTNLWYGSVDGVWVPLGPSPRYWRAVRGPGSVLDTTYGRYDQFTTTGSPVSLGFTMTIPTGEALAGRYTVDYQASLQGSVASTGALNLYNNDVLQDTANGGLAANVMHTTNGSWSFVHTGGAMLWTLKYLHTSGSCTVWDRGTQITATWLGPV